MSTLSVKNYDAPDEVRTPALTTVDVINVGPFNTSRTTFQPGWKWSECIKPVAGTETCQNHHVGVAVAGRIHVQHGDESIEIGPGDAFNIEPGHDAWVLGDEPYVAYEFDLHAATTFGTPA